MVGLFITILQLSQYPSHKFLIVLQLVSLLEGHVDYLLLVLHDLLTFNQLCTHLQHL